MHIISLHFYVTLWVKFNFTLHTSIMNTCLVKFTSFHFSQSVLSNSLWPHELQHARPPCATPTSRAYPNSCPLSWWCHPTISSSVVPLSSCIQSFPASGSSPMSHIFVSGNQNIGISASASVLPMKSLLQHHSSKASILWHSAFFTVQFSHPYMITGKTIALTRLTLVGKVMSLLFNMLSRLVITFIPRSKHLLISWLQLPSTVILEPPKIKVWHCFHCFPIYLPWSDGTRCHNLCFLNVEL